MIELADMSSRSGFNFKKVFLFMLSLVSMAIFAKGAGGRPDVNAFEKEVQRLEEQDKKIEADIKAVWDKFKPTELVPPPPPVKTKSKSKSKAKTVKAEPTYRHSKQQLQEIRQQLMPIAARAKAHFREVDSVNRLLSGVNLDEQLKIPKEEIAAIEKTKSPNPKIANDPKSQDLAKVVMDRIRLVENTVKISTLKIRSENRVIGFEGQSAASQAAARQSATSPSGKAPAKCYFGFFCF